MPIALAAYLLVPLTIMVHMAVITHIPAILTTIQARLQHFRIITMAVPIHLGADTILGMDGKLIFNLNI